MIRINVEVRFANTMEGCPEYYEASKEELLRETVLMAHEAACHKYPELRDLPYVITPSKRWSQLKGKSYWFKEDPEQDYYGICFIVKKPITMPEGEIVPVYLSLPTGSDLPEIVIDFMDS